MPFHHAGSQWDDQFAQSLENRPEILEAVAALPDDLRGAVMDLAGELLVQPADVLHCWLDRHNIIGFIASRIAATPAVVLSLRNVNPENFPRFLAPWMRPWYRLAAELPQVTLVANSQAGAQDYERWLGLPAGRIGVLRNAFVPAPRPAPAEADRLRQQLGITAEAPVLAGVFRLDPEKRPLVFLEVVDRLRQRFPTLQVLHAGTGTLEVPFRAEIRRRRLEQVVHVLGQRSDVPTILAASQVLLLTSEQEGTPNVVLEAAHAGVTPVVTDAGGTRETLEAGVTGHLVGVNDVDGLVTAATSLLGDPVSRQRMAEAGRRLLAERFDPQQVFRQTTTVYDQLLADTQKV